MRLLHVVEPIANEPPRSEDVGLVGPGGHFAAMEAPDLLVDDIRAFFRTMW